MNALTAISKPPTSSSLAGASTIATWALAVVRALEAEGHASAPLLREAGIDPAWLHDGNQRIALTSMSRLWRAARRVSGDDSFGLRVSRHCFPTDFHGLLFAIQSSSTIGEALERVVRFSPVVTTSANLELRREGGRCKLLYHPLPGVHTEQIATEALIASSIRFARQSWGEVQFIAAVELRRPRPHDAAQWEALLGCPVWFDAPCNAVVYEQAPLGLALRSGNSELAQSLDQVLGAYLKRLRQGSLPEQVRDAIVRMLPLGEVQQSAVAEELGMSVRNLHRHLQRHDSSFKELLDDTRRHLAFDYLRQSHCPVNEVCYRLGFNEPSSFNRAFRRWTGTTPGQWRLDLARPAPASTRAPAAPLEWLAQSLPLAV